MTNIEWVKNAAGGRGQTWNPIVGCSVTSLGCTNCYAMKMAYRIRAASEVKDGESHYCGTVKLHPNGMPIWTGKVAMAPDHILLAPLKRRKPTTYFVNSMSDLFHENVSDEWIDRVFAVMALCPQHTFQVLTKRSARMRQYCSTPDRLTIVREQGFVDHGGRVNGRHARDIPTEKTWPMPNLWLGVSTEDQKRADERIPDLLATPAAVRFVSAEPLLGALDLTDIDLVPMLLRGRTRSENDPKCTFNALTGKTNVHQVHGVDDPFNRGLDWVIVGGESGPGARPMHPDWARSLRDQCADAGVPFFFKQWGEWSPSTPELAKNNPRSGWQPNRAHPCVAKAAELYPEAGAAFIANVGKKASGRLLDGVEHNGMPEVRHG